MKVAIVPVSTQLWFGGRSVGSVISAISLVVYRVSKVFLIANRWFLKMEAKYQLTHEVVDERR